MSNSFKIKTRSDGTYFRNERNQVLVTGADAGELTWLDHTQLDSIAHREAHLAAHTKVAEAVDAAIKADPVAVAIEEAKAQLAEATKVSRLPEKFISRTIVEAKAGVDGDPGVVVVYNHDSQVLLLIQDGAFDNLVWDLSQSGSAKIQVVF